MSSTEELLSIQDLAKRLGVSARRARYVADEARRKRGIGRKIGRSWVFTAKEVDEIVRWKKGGQDVQQGGSGA